MRYIRKRELTATVIALVVIILGVVIFSKHLKDYPLPQKQIATSTPTLAIKLTSFSHSYRRGKYTFDGAITVPTVCYIASAKSALVPSTTPTLIRLTVTVPTDTGRCLQLPATTTFSIAQHSDKNATVRVYLNGKLATSTAL